MSTRTRWSRRIALVVAFTGLAVPAHAQKEWSGRLLGANENPANASAAYGWADVVLTGNILTVNETWQGLTGGNAAAAHIHCCVAPGSNVGVAIPFTGFPNTASGTYFGTFDLTNLAVYTATFVANFGGGTAAGAEAALIAGLDAGNAYANIHDQVYPGGEIRANLVVATPEPSSIMLVASGLVGFAGLGWSRRRSA
ncbi:MAG: CHRD domain-containing protein [Gemmatimonadota bacterium]|nr:CHRD domain-containing protein [Gemmatimonadota bacterium]